MNVVKTAKLFLLFSPFFYTAFSPANTFANECIDGNCINGYGIYLYSSGREYVGWWKNGKRHGEGTLTYHYGSKYTGEWKNDRMHGRGIKIYPDGSKYVGGWKNGHKHGRGTMYSRGMYSKYRYIGEWENGYRHGKGELVYQRHPEEAEYLGAKYVGEWKKDKRNGKGISTTPDGSSKYVGEWRNNKRHGQGTLTYANTVFTGEWKNGRRHQGTLICPDGSKYSGSEWKFMFMRFKELRAWGIENGYSEEQLVNVLGLLNEFKTGRHPWEFIYNHLQLILECLVRRGGER